MSRQDIGVLVPSKPRRRRERNLRRTVVSISALLLVSLGTNVYQAWRTATPMALGVDGGIGNKVPSEGDVEAWVSKVAAGTLTLTFNDLRSQRLAEADRFTPEGYREMLSEMGTSRFSRRVLDDQLATRAVVTGAPTTLSRTGDEATHVSWRMVVPLAVTVESASERIYERHNVDLDVEWVTSGKEPHLAVTRYSLSE